MNPSQLIASIVVSLFIGGIAWMLYGMVRASAQSVGINVGMGIRLPSLMKDEHSWKNGHAAATPVFYWSAICTSLFSVVAAATSAVEPLYIACILVSTASLTVGSTMGIIVAHRVAMATPPASR